MSKSNASLPASFKSLLKDVKTRIQQAQTRAILSANAELVRMYWDVGRMIAGRQKREGWGAGVIPRLARELRNDLPEVKGFSDRNIKRMLAFYRAYPTGDPTAPPIVAHLPPPEKVPRAAAQTNASPKVPQPAAQLSDSLLWSIPWFHHIILIEKVKDLAARVWYMEQTNRLKKAVLLTPEFEELWKRIKPKTLYRVEFETDQLVNRAVAGVKAMAKIEPPKIRITTGQVEVVKGGVTSTAISAAVEQVSHHERPVPDILAYLQNETELTRSTLVRILKESGRLAEFFVDPQRYMDAVAHVLKYELHRLLVTGIKYEKIDGSGPDAEWEMTRFESKELIDYLTAIQVNHSVYEYVAYDSEVEKEFARKLDQREDIKLFVKLPSWFEIDTPVGKYNPDWAIVKHDGQALYLVRETKSTKDFLKLRTSEADKVRCGQKHFETLGVPFSVVVSADEV